MRPTLSSSLPCCRSRGRWDRGNSPLLGGGENCLGDSPHLLWEGHFFSANFPFVNQWFFFKYCKSPYQYEAVVPPSIRKSLPEMKRPRFKVKHPRHSEYTRCLYRTLLHIRFSPCKDFLQQKIDAREDLSLRAPLLTKNRNPIITAKRIAPAPPQGFSTLPSPAVSSNAKFPSSCG